MKRYLGIVRLLITLLLISCDSPSGPLPPDPSPVDFAFADRLPAPRPNSTQISFIRQIGPSCPDSVVGGLYLVDISSLESVMLLEGLFGRPMWIDHNNVVVNYLSGEDYGSFCKYNIETDELEYICTSGGMNCSINLSDSLIVFDSSDRKIRVLSLKTYEVSIITQYFGFQHPFWAPDNTSIIVSHTASNSSRIISELSREGTIIKNYTSVVDSKYDSYPQWNNAKNIIIYSTTGPHTEDDNITILNLDSNASSIVAKGIYPFFSNDSNTVFYSQWTTESNQELRIFRVVLSSGQIEQLTF